MYFIDYGEPILDGLGVERNDITEEVTALFIDGHNANWSYNDYMFPGSTPSSYTDVRTIAYDPENFTFIAEDVHVAYAALFCEIIINCETDNFYFGTVTTTAEW